MVGISKAITDEDDARVDEESDEDAGGDYFGIRILVLI